MADQNEKKLYDTILVIKSYVIRERKFHKYCFMLQIFLF